MAENAEVMVRCIAIPQIRPTRPMRGHCTILVYNVVTTLVFGSRMSCMDPAGVLRPLKHLRRFFPGLRRTGGEDFADSFGVGGQVSGAISNRHMNCSASPFFLLGACNHQQDFFNSLGNRKSVVQDEDATHIFSGDHSFIGIIGQASAIMRHNDAFILSGPSQDFRVLRAGKTNVLHANELEVWLAQ